MSQLDSALNLQRQKRNSETLNGDRYQHLWVVLSSSALQMLGGPYESRPDSALRLDWTRNLGHSMVRVRKPREQSWVFVRDVSVFFFFLRMGKLNYNDLLH